MVPEIDPRNPSWLKAIADVIGGAYERLEFRPGNDSWHALVERLEDGIGDVREAERIELSRHGIAVCWQPREWSFFPWSTVGVVPTSLGG